MGRMSELAAYMASIEALYPHLSLYGDGDERCARFQEEREQWEAEEAGSQEYANWSDQINAQNGEQR